MNETLTKNPENDYELDYIDDGSPAGNGELEPLFDKDGNPTPETLRACRELELGLGEEMTLDEFFSELDEICRPI